MLIRLPIIFTRAFTILKMMKPVSVSDNNFPVKNFGYHFCYIMAIPANPQVHNNPKGNTLQTN